MEVTQIGVIGEQRGTYDKMRIEPVENKYGKPIPYPVSFGILKGYKKTPYGEYTWGIYKGHKIEVFDATEKYNQKLHYVSNNQTLKWIESKLRYFQDGIKRIIRSKAK